MPNEKRGGLFEMAKSFLEKVPETLHDHFENVDGSLKQISAKINDGVEEILPMNEIKRFNDNLERLNNNIEKLRNSPTFQELGKFLCHINEFGLWFESRVKELQESHSHSLNIRRRF